MHIFKRLSSKAQTLILFGIVIIAASLFRLTYLQLIEFKGDEALNLFLATRPLFGHPFPPGSLASSVGILNFPLLNYFLFPIVLISYFPPFVSACIALLNILAIGGYFLLLQKYTTRLTAFITAIFLSLAPWSILYGRKIWAQDFLIPLVVTLLFCFFKIYKEKKQIFWIFYAIFSLFLIQIHQTSGILPVLLAIPLIRKTKPKIPLLLLGIFIGILPALPYIWYEILNKCPDCTTLSLLHTKLQQYNPDIILRIFQIITTAYFHTIFGNTDNLLFTNLYPFVAELTKLSYLVYIFLPVSIIFFWKRYKEYRSFIFITLLILLVFLLLKIQSEMHYVIILLPFLFLFIGSLLSALITYKKYFVKIVGVAFFVLFFTLYITFDYSFFQLLSIKKGFGGDYGSTYAIAQEGANKTLHSFKYDSSYQEMVLAYYIPKASIQGDTPDGQILYPLLTLQKKLPTLIEKLHQRPDPRIFNQLLAYYTYPQNETMPNIFMLQKLAINNFSYQELYDFVLSDYLATHYKHYYTDANFWIQYPSYWQQTQQEDSVSFSDEHVSFILFFDQQQLPQLLPTQKWKITHKNIHNQSVIEDTCLDNNKWCGSYIPLLVANGKNFSIAMKSFRQTTDQKTLVNDRNILENILDTTIPLPY